VPGIESTCQFIRQLRQSQTGSAWRQLVVISGEQGWAEQLLSHSELSGEQLWIGDSTVGLMPPESTKAISGKQAHQVLGQERDLVVFDCWSGFNPNAFGQVSGIVIAGGILILVTPPLEQWPDFIDPEYVSIATLPYHPADVGRRFIRHLRTCILDDQYVTLIEQGKPLPMLPALANCSEIDDPIEPFRSMDQQALVKHVLAEFEKDRSRAIVMTADRGRGKTASLGIIASELLLQGHRNIVVTAPSRAAVQPLFQLAQRLLEEQEYSCEIRAGVIECAIGNIRFIQPDQLLQEQPQADLLLVDEAAAIPAPVLKQMLRYYPGALFSSTIHGYEGTGQGFAVRFRKGLDQLSPDWISLKLSQPIRWADEDPLEQFTYKALLLDAEFSCTDKMDSSAIHYRRIDRDQLLADSILLRELFGLLILAHYRTTPGDLRILLDSPNLQVWGGFLTTQTGSEVLVTTALLAEEGNIEPTLAVAIEAGKRRPKGHLIPQTLLAHSGLSSAGQSCGLRVMRIAVSPESQRQGIGLAMLCSIEQQMRKDGYDWIGTSYGLTVELLRFWQQAGLSIARIGHTRDKVSGTHAAVMLKGFSDAGLQLQDRASEHWRGHRERQLSSGLSDLETALIEQLSSD